MRHTLRGLVGHNGYYACEYGTGKGYGRQGWPYPMSTDCPRRRHDQVLNIARYHRHKWLKVSMHNCTADMTCRNHLHDGLNIRLGIHSYSPLLDLNQGFDIVEDVVVDEFHLLREGLTKLMLNRMFDSQQSEAMAIRRNLNAKLIETRVFSEMPRRTRSLSVLKDYKGICMSLMLCKCQHGFFNLFMSIRQHQSMASS